METAYPLLDNSARLVDEHFELTQSSEEEITKKIENIPNLDNNSKLKLLSILLKHISIFSERPGLHKSFVYDLQVRDDVVIHSKQYPIPHLRSR